MTWRTTPDLEKLNANLKNTIGEVLDIASRRSTTTR